jgi:hypothetical protein
VADFLDRLDNVGIGGRLNLDKPWLEALVRAVLIDALQKEEVIVYMHIERTAKALDKRHRSGLACLWSIACLTALLM